MKPIKIILLNLIFMILISWSSLNVLAECPELDDVIQPNCFDACQQAYGYSDGWELFIVEEKNGVVSTDHAQGGPCEWEDRVMPPEGTGYGEIFEWDEGVIEEDGVCVWYREETCTCWDCPTTTTTTTNGEVPEFTGYTGIVVALIVVLAVAFLLIKRKK